MNRQGSMTIRNTNPDVTLSAEERTVSGLGICMVKKSMDGMRYKYENVRNIFPIPRLPG